MYEVSTEDPSTRKCWYLAVSNCYSAKKVKLFFEGSPTLEQKRLRSDNSTALDLLLSAAILSLWGRPSDLVQDISPSAKRNILIAPKVNV